MAARYDAIVIGAGLSGLSLAAHLASSPSAAHRVLVIDGGRQGSDGRRWGFWATDPGWVSPALHASWDALSVTVGGHRLVRRLSPFRYHEVRGAAFGELARTHIARAPEFAVVSGRAEHVREESGHASVVVDGERLGARWIFDSRPPPDARTGAGLSFLGWEVETKSDAFDPAVMTFMDFRARRQGRMAFAYVLPTTPRRALVEIADFGWLPPADLAADLEHYLRTCCDVGAWSVLETEEAWIPLTAGLHPSERGHVVPIGRRAGMLKPSTGYAFTRIQRHSAALCQSLAQWGHPHDLPKASRRHAWLDSVLLDVVRRDPDAIEAAFQSLFARNSAPSILRFLDEDSTPARDARLIASLPPEPFVRAVVQRLR